MVVSDNTRLLSALEANWEAEMEGFHTFDKISAMEQWAEQGKTPEQIIAAHKTAGKIDRTRPLCPYPQVAHYNGTGTTRITFELPVIRQQSVPRAPGCSQKFVFLAQLSVFPGEPNDSQKPKTLQPGWEWLKSGRHVQKDNLRP